MREERRVEKRRRRRTRSDVVAVVVVAIALCLTSNLFGVFAVERGGKRSLVPGFLPYLSMWKVRARAVGQGWSWF